MLSSHLVLRKFTKTFSRQSRTAYHATIRSFSGATTEVIPGMGKGKTSTGIVGLKVDHDAIPKIIAKNQALLDCIEASDMPPTAQYRIDVEALAKYRIDVCKNHPDDPESVENLIRMGQVEELVEQADAEMACLEMYLDRRMWEYISPVEIEFDPTRDEKEVESD